MATNILQNEVRYSSSGTAINNSNWHRVYFNNLLKGIYQVCVMETNSNLYYVATFAIDNDTSYYHALNVWNTGYDIDLVIGETRFDELVVPLLRLVTTGNHKYSIIKLV
jgi:hypothetical protein